MIESHRKQKLAVAFGTNSIEVICDSLAGMNAFEGVKGYEASAEMAADFLPDLREATLESRKEATGPPNNVEGKASSEFGDYTKEEYENFGWVRANNILSAGYWKNFTENFAQAVTGNYSFPKTKNGEFMIEVYDAYDNDSVADVIMVARGTIDSPNISKVVKINATQKNLDNARRLIYESAGRGIQQETGELFQFYDKTAYVFSGAAQGQGRASVGNSSRNGFRSRSEIKANRIVKFHVDENKGTITITYANGETVTESLGKTKGKASVDLFEEMDADYLSAVERGDTETAQRMVDDAAKQSGYSIRAYHGTPNTEFTVFDKDRVGKGNDQYGAGFYFATDKDAASHYGRRVIDSVLSINNPIRMTANASVNNLIQADITLTSKQAYEVVKRLPDIYDAENSPLGDYFDSYWEVGAKDWMIRELAEQYRDVGLLDSDLFRYYPNELHEALRDVVGHDGVEVTFESSGEKFYVAWFANQIKSAAPVTYDDNGNVIPLSERFNSSEPDIRFSQELFEDIDEEVAEELSPREMLAKMLEREDMTPSQKGLLTQYKNKLAMIEANEAEVAKLTEELDTLKKNGKGNTAKADVIKNKIKIKHRVKNSHGVLSFIR